MWTNQQAGKSIAGGDIFGELFPEETGYGDDWYVVKRVAGENGFIGIFRQPETQKIAVFRHKKDADIVAGVLSRLFATKYTAQIVNPHVVNASILGELYIIPKEGNPVLSHEYMMWLIG